MVMIVVRVSASLKQKIQEEAEKKDMIISELVRDILRNYFKTIAEEIDKNER